MPATWSGPPRLPRARIAAERTAPSASPVILTSAGSAERARRSARISMKTGRSPGSPNSAASTICFTASSPRRIVSARRAADFSGSAAARDRLSTATSVPLPSTPSPCTAAARTAGSCDATSNAVIAGIAALSPRSPKAPISSICRSAGSLASSAANLPVAASPLAAWRMRSRPIAQKSASSRETSSTVISTTSSAPLAGPAAAAKRAITRQ